MKRLPVAVLVALAGLAAPATALAAAETTTTQFRAEIPLEYGPACSGEVVLLEGEIHFVEHQTVDATGGFHDFDLVHLSNLTGTSESGTVYHFQQASVQSLNDPVGSGSSSQ